MARIDTIDLEQTSGSLQALLTTITEQMGTLPNVLLTMARSQAVLVAYLHFSAGLYNASIGMVMGELLALAVSDANGSRYCDAVHTYNSKGLAIAPEIIHQARLGRSTAERISEALAFAKSVIASRGADLPPAVHRLKMSNYSEQEIVEVIAQIALSIFSNYINLVASTENDYPGDQ